MLIQKQYSRSILLQISIERTKRQCISLLKKQKNCLRFFTRNCESAVILFCFNIILVFFFSSFIQSRVFFIRSLPQLIQLNLKSRFIVNSQLGPRIQSGSSSGAGLQMVTQFIHQSKDCYPQLVSNLHRSEIRHPKQLDCRCMPLHPPSNSSV